MTDIGFHRQVSQESQNVTPSQISIVRIVIGQSEAFGERTTRLSTLRSVRVRADAQALVASGTCVVKSRGFSR